MVPPTQGGREDLCFPTSPVELGAQAGTAKLLSPCTQGPLAWGNISPLNPANGRLAAWAAGGNGREFRSPLEQGSAGRGRVPSRLMSLGTQVHGRPAAWAAGARESRARKGSVETAVSETQVHGQLAAWGAGGNGRNFRSPLEQGSPGRGRVPSRLMSPKPKSMAGWQHGLPAGTAANSEALLSRGVQGEEGFRRDSCLRNPSPWPAGSTGCRRGRLPPSWCGFRTRYETQGV